MDTYEQVRATLIAEEFGWVGFAADIYGAEYVDAGDENTTDRRAQTTLYRSNHTLFYNRIQAAVDFVKAHPAVDAEKVAVIGCKYL